MFDKLLLNNQLLASKKSMQKVKVHLVNKLVHKLRKLKQLNDKYPENNNLKTKIMKATETLVYLKKTNSIEVQKQALLNEKNPQVVITNGRSSPEEVAQALYFAHKNTVDIVKKLKKLFHLDDSDTTWKEHVSELSKRKRKLMRTEKKQMFRQERKARHELTLKRNEWLIENVLTSEPTEEVVKSTKVEAYSEAISRIILPCVQSKPNVNQTKQRQRPPDLDPVQLLASDEEEKQPANIRAVDPFFITETGNNYLSTAVVDRVQPEAPNDGLVRKERRAARSDYPARGRGGPKIRKSYEKKWENKRQTINNLQSHSPGNKKSSTVNISRREVDKGDQHERLHPSWMAKQKQKGGIHAFQGTKITFDDESVNSHKKSASVGDVEKLHPSWAAKQKLKPSIAEFKGKKIVFGDD